MLESGISEMKNMQREVVQIKFNGIDTNELDMPFEFENYIAETRGDRVKRTKIILKETIELHLMLANTYYKEQLKKKIKVIFP